MVRSCVRGRIATLGEDATMTVRVITTTLPPEDRSGPVPAILLRTIGHGKRTVRPTRSGPRPRRRGRGPRTGTGTGTGQPLTDCGSRFSLSSADGSEVADRRLENTTMPTTTATAT